MGPINLYVCLLHLRHEASGEKMSINTIEFAPTEQAALQLAKASIREAAFASATRGWIVEEDAVLKVGNEILERAAKEILGWNPPSP
jgi:hypothetical protein